MATNHTECFITHLMTRDEQIDFLSCCPSITVGKAIVVGQNKTENIQFILRLAKGFMTFLNVSFSLFLSHWSYISKQNLEIIQFVHLLDFFWQDASSDKYKQFQSIFCFLWINHFLNKFWPHGSCLNDWSREIPSITQLSIANLKIA